MALNVKAALDTARRAWVDNADFMTTASATKAQAFIAAGRQLLVLMPEEVGSPAATTRMRMEGIEKSIASAESWLNANPATSGSSAAGGSQVVRGDVSNFRE